MSILFALMFQAAAGAPAEAPDQTAQPAEVASETPAQPAAEAQPQRTCTVQTVTGSRVRRARVCSDPNNRAAVQRAWSQMVDSAGRSPFAADVGPSAGDN